MTWNQLNVIFGRPLQLEYSDACQEREGSGRRGEMCNQRSWRQWLGVNVPVTRPWERAGVTQLTEEEAAFDPQTRGFKRLLLSRVGRLLGHVGLIQGLNAKRLADLLGEVVFITMG